MLTELECRKKLIELFEGVGVYLGTELVEEAPITDEMDSLQFISLICDIEDTFGITLYDDELMLEEYESINDFIEKVIAKVVGKRNEK